MVLHFYQPPTQEIGITKSILDACYLPLLRLLSRKSNFGLTLNLSGSLLFQLQQLEANEFFDLVRQLISDQKIELLNSVVYHPLIPLTPPDVVTRQIHKTQHLLQDLFGVEKINGFFPPELAIDSAGLDLIDSQYIVVDQTAIDSQASIAKLRQKYLLVNNRPVCELLRSYPRQLTSDIITNLVFQNCPENKLIITANDAELFGHHYIERLQVLTDLLDRQDFKFITASKAVSQFGHDAVDINIVKPSTWQNCQEFSLWNKNELQAAYLNLVKTGHDLLGANIDEKTADSLDRSYSSCYLYWLSNWPWWHPDIVQDGANSLITSVRMAKISPDNKIRMEADYHSFLSRMWQYQWSGQVEKNYQKYNQAADKFLGV